MRRTFFRPERPTLTSRSLQSITRPFQKRFREVFGNARILIFYLSIKAWEEKSLPKSHLGWFFLVFDEGKATKENISIFWFIWPLNDKSCNLHKKAHLLQQQKDDLFRVCYQSLAFSRLSVIHLVPPPPPLSQKRQKIVSVSPWVLQSSQENIKQCLCKIFCGQQQLYCG